MKTYQTYNSLQKSEGMLLFPNNKSIAKISILVFKDDLLCTATFLFFYDNDYFLHYVWLCGVVRQFCSTCFVSKFEKSKLQKVKSVKCFVYRSLSIVVFNIYHLYFLPTDNKIYPINKNKHS